MPIAWLYPDTIWNPFRGKLRKVANALPELGARLLDSYLTPTPAGR
jgi:hypothetical protein